MEEVPVVFRSPRALRVLNVAAVAASVAACTSATFMYLLKPHEWTWALIAGLPTTFCAAAWAMCLRWRKTTKTGVRYGWLLSVPLAALNSALAGGAFLAVDAFYPYETTKDASNTIGGFIGGALLGGTFGVVVWLPALIAVLVVFGLPIARAQKMARLGIAGEERGEVLVGVVSAVLGAIALALAWSGHGNGSYVQPLWLHASAAGQIFMHALSFLAVACGASAAWVALLREARRRRFVARVEASEVPGFRVEKSIAGKVLLRVAPVAHYRVSDASEELFELDETGRVTHDVQGASRSQSA